jgi:hypothetical protein
MMLGYRHRPNPLVGFPFYYVVSPWHVLSYYVTCFHVAVVFAFYRTILARLITERTSQEILCQVYCGESYPL